MLWLSPNNLSSKIPKNKNGLASKPDPKNPFGASLPLR